MDWRIQGAGQVVGILLAAIPFFLGPNTLTSHDAFVSTWLTIIGVMRYLLIAGIALETLGIAWKGIIGRGNAWLLIFTSIGLGLFMLWAGIGVVFVTIDAPGLGLASVVAPASTLLEIGFLIPALSFVSSLVWLFWDGRRNPRPVSIPRLPTSQ